ncbi:baseplate assembly protein [Snodgrassella alvi]|uniref:baseplate assembly protein n=1 Tax=Snodgrassella alvi TaxID=1196083 RepID=UPI000C1ECAB1|nr:baseplate J/gp47 family protein [Snodgrassella alvi]PIT07292.1 baseplate assembly protein [Snodgrassella alvi]PIT57073.1 baseplate assembly protein [Snodgrassella alvi]
MTDLTKLARADVKVVEDDLATILAETITDYQNRTGKVLQPAHIERLLINTYAYREALTRQQINEAYRQQHVRFATGLMLDLCGDDVHTPRLQAQPAQTTLRFQAKLTGKEQVVIPKGTRVTVDSLIFATVEAGLLTAASTSVELAAVCQSTGIMGNGWSSGQINTLIDHVSDVIEVKVSNITTSSGGVDIESDDAYRVRVLLAPESFSVAGPVGAYEYFTRQVSQDIIDVYITNDTDKEGNSLGGVVAVTLLTKAGLPSMELINQVQTALSDERVRPLCDRVVVRAPKTFNYQVAATLTLFVGADAQAVLTAAKAAWQQYQYSQEQRLGVDVVPLVIQSLLKVDGVYNVATPELKLTTVAADTWAHCTNLNLTIAEEAVDG